MFTRDSFVHAIDNINVETTVTWDDILKQVINVCNTATGCLFMFNTIPTVATGLGSNLVGNYLFWRYYHNTLSEEYAKQDALRIKILAFDEINARLRGLYDDSFTALTPPLPRPNENVYTSMLIIYALIAVGNAGVKLAAVINKPDNFIDTPWLYLSFAIVLFCTKSICDLLLGKAKEKTEKLEKFLKILGRDSIIVTNDIDLTLAISNLNHQLANNSQTRTNAQLENLTHDEEHTQPETAPSENIAAVRMATPLAEQAIAYSSLSASNNAVAEETSPDT